jgi:predicted dehydrogenase
MTATRIGFIGAGWIARVHLRVLAGFDDVAVVAVSSRSLESAGRFAEAAGARAYPDYRSMFEQAGLDAVFICVTPEAHDDAELAAADRGIAIFVEKPLGLDEEGPARSAERIRATGVPSCVGYQWRYLDVVDRARELLQSHPPQLVLGFWHEGTPGAKWWIKKDVSGGQIVEQATHIFDLARYLVGEAEPIASAGRPVARPAFPDSDILDVTQTSLRFASGAIGSISTTCLLDGGQKVGLETVSDGMAMALEILDPRLVVQLGPETTTYRPRSSFDTPYERQDRAFIDAVRGKPNRIRSPYDDALLTHRLTMAASRLAFGSQAEGMDAKA